MPQGNPQLLITKINGTKVMKDGMKIGVHGVHAKNVNMANK
jgi:hypothetical protein